jgi:hypothetical protein
MASILSTTTSSPLSRVENLFDKKARAATSAASFKSESATSPGRKHGATTRDKKTGQEAKENDGSHTTPKQSSTKSESDDEDNWQGGPWNPDEVSSLCRSCLNDTTSPSILLTFITHV